MLYGWESHLFLEVIQTYCDIYRVSWYSQNILWKRAKYFILLLTVVLSFLYPRYSEHGLCYSSHLVSDPSMTHLNGLHIVCAMWQKAILQCQNPQKCTGWAKYKNSNGVQKLLILAVFAYGEKCSQLILSSFVDLKQAKYKITLTVRYLHFK